MLWKSRNPSKIAACLLFLIYVSACFPGFMRNVPLRQAAKAISAPFGRIAEFHYGIEEPLDLRGLQAATACAAWPKRL